MSDIDAKISMIQSRIEAARIAKARAEAVRETAQESEDKAMAQLAAQFGVDNVAQARAKLAELQAEVQTMLTEITTVLDTIEL